MVLLTSPKPRGTKRAKQAEAAARSLSPSPKKTPKKAKTTPAASATKSAAKKATPKKATPAAAKKATPKKAAAPTPKEKKSPTPKKSATKAASPARRVNSTVKLTSPGTPAEQSTLEDKYGEEMVNFMMGNYNEHTAKYAKNLPKKFKFEYVVAFAVVLALVLSAAFFWRSRAV